MEARWLKLHKEVMGLEEKKTKLLSEIELLQKRSSELSEAVTDLHKKTVVNRSDWKEVERERINQLDNLNEETVNLIMLNEEEKERRRKLSKELSNLQNSIQGNTQALENAEKRRSELNQSVDSISLVLDELGRAKKMEEDERRESIKRLSGELKQKKSELRETKNELSDIHDNILKENRLLSIRRSDLQIYEARLKKKYPKQKFVLKDDAITTKN